MFPDGMTALLTERGVFWGLAVVSAAGAVVALICWRRRAGAIRTGFSVVAALAWPLWELFGALDRWLDVTTIVGMAAPYVVFVIIGAGLGFALARGERSGLRRGPAGSEIEGKVAPKPEV
ncbi:MAG TPA: hypothetical protein VFJ58_00990 [Armatimonadota bacterium]|nr:hypothetical protein [Armatimonadota bacterium]